LFQTDTYCSSVILPIGNTSFNLNFFSFSLLFLSVYNILYFLGFVNSFFEVFLTFLFVISNKRKTIDLRQYFRYNLIQTYEMPAAADTNAVKTAMDKENNMSDMDMTPDIYTLVDEEGNEQAFELLDVLDLDDNRYFALIPYYENPEESIEDDGDLVILKSEMVDDEEMMASIDDDEEYERVGAIFLERLDNMFDDEFDGDVEEIDE
jgi:uncharacterized protein YrzB (UPF0473 family)